MLAHRSWICSIIDIKRSGKGIHKSIGPVILFCDKNRFFRSCCMIWFVTLMDIICPKNTISAVYYVDNAHPQASDSGFGAKESPWRTIQHAANRMNPGDICHVEDGFYEEHVLVRKSGYAGEYITFCADGKVVMRGFSILDAAHIRIIGFEITHEGSNIKKEGIGLTGARDCQLLDNYIHHTYSLGIWMRQLFPTHDVLIRGNRISFTGGVTGNSVGETAIKIWGNNNLIEYNNISHVGDFLNVWGERNIIRNNYFHDCYDADFPDYQMEGGHHIDGLQYWSDNAMRLTSTLVENNLFADIAVEHGHIILLQDELNTGSSHFIFRNNVGVRIGSYPFSVQGVKHVKVYSNTFVDGLSLQSPKAPYCVSFTDSAQNGCVTNNIFVNSAGQGGGVYYIDQGSVDGFYGDYNCAYTAPDNSSGWSAPITDERHSILNSAPDFVHYQDDNFHLLQSSPCLDAGGPLTTTVTSGEGCSINLHDAKCFSDGWELTEGDMVKIGSNDSLKILSIDYDAGVITINKHIIWEQDEWVHRICNGIAPDMGAFEYREGQDDTFGITLLKPFNGSRLCGIVKVDMAVQNQENVRYITLSVNGLQQVTLQEPPFTWSWNTDGFSEGSYILEATAYARQAGVNIKKSDKISVVIAENNDLQPPVLRFRR